MQSEPDSLRLRCFDAASPLSPFEDHAFALSLLLRDGGFGPRLSNPFELENCLVLAAGLKSVSIVTEGLCDQDVYCPNEYEATRGVIASGIATELTRMLLVWGAVDLTMRTAVAAEASEETVPRRLSRFVGSGSPSLLHHECVANNLLVSLENYGSAQYADGAARARKFDAPLIAQGTFAAYQVRNCFVHGAVEWPDDYEESIVRSARIGRLACHVLVFAIQELMLRSVDCTAGTADMCEDNEGFQTRLIKDVLPSVHLGAHRT